LKEQPQQASNGVQVSLILLNLRVLGDCFW